jgi:hypothetical protein
METEYNGAFKVCFISQSILIRPYVSRIFTIKFREEKVETSKADNYAMNGTCQRKRVLQTSEDVT